MQSDPTKSLPCFPEGERAVLSAMLLDSTAALRAMDELASDDFWREAHRIVFRAMLSIHAKRQPIDWLTITRELQSSGELERIGGIEFLTSLSDCAPSAANIIHYIGVVKEKALLRNTISACKETIARCGQPQCDLKQVVEEHYHSMIEIGNAASREKKSKGLQRIGQVVSESFTGVVDRKQSGKLPGIGSGFKDLDAWTGGLHPGELTIIAARPSMGKSALAVDIAYNVSSSWPVAFFSLEMSEDQLGQRMLARGARVNLLSIRSGQVQDWQMDSLTRYLGEADDHDLYVDFTPAISPMHVMLRCEELMLRSGNKLGLVVIDYLQLMRSTERIKEREQQVASVSRDLKTLAKQLDVPVISLCQLNRELEKRPNKRPQMNDLRESGAIEQDADNIHGLYRHSKYDADYDEYEAENIILKQRNGAVGTFNLRWIKEWVTFQDWEAQDGTF